MGVVPFSTEGPHKSVVFRRDQFRVDGDFILILEPDTTQFPGAASESNASYDLRVGRLYRDHRNDSTEALREGESLELLPGSAVIIQTEESVGFPKHLFGNILPRVSLLQKGIANTPSKVDPGYDGPLLITTFNHGKRVVSLKQGERFCSLHLLTVEDGIRPYNKRPKELEPRPRSKWFQRLGDKLEVRQIWFTLIIAVGTVAAVALALWPVH